MSDRMSRYSQKTVCSLAQWSLALALTLGCAQPDHGNQGGQSTGGEVSSEARAAGQVGTGSSEEAYTVEDMETVVSQLLSRFGTGTEATSKHPPGSLAEAFTEFNLLSRNLQRAVGRMGVGWVTGEEDTEEHAEALAKAKADLERFMAERPAFAHGVKLCQERSAELAERGFRKSMAKAGLKLVASARDRDVTAELWKYRLSAGRVKVFCVLRPDAPRWVRDTDLSGSAKGLLTHGGGELRAGLTEAGSSWRTAPLPLGSWYGGCTFTIEEELQPPLTLVLTTRIRFGEPAPEFVPLTIPTDEVGDYRFRFEGLPLPGAATPAGSP